MQRAGGSTGTQKAAQLLSQAKRSVGNLTAVHEAKQDLGRLIEEYERIVEMLEKMEKDVIALLSEIPMANNFGPSKG